jgi:hypothetical protein
VETKSDELGALSLNLHYSQRRRCRHLQNQDKRSGNSVFLINPAGIDIVTEISASQGAKIHIISHKPWGFLPFPDKVRV